MIASVRGCSLVEQIKRIKEKALGAKDEEQVEYLTSVLDALTTCVSSLHEREHESLINEVLEISIWQATPVSLAQPSFTFGHCHDKERRLSTLLIFCCIWSPSSLRMLRLMRMSAAYMGSVESLKCRCACRI